MRIFVKGSLYTLLLTSLMLLHAVQAPSPPRTPAPGFGAVEGMVLGEGGRPVPGVTVFAVPENGPPLPGFGYEVHADAKGKFFLPRVWPGLNRLCAKDQSKFYPETGTTFYDSDFPYPEVRVKEAEIARNVIIRLGPRAGRLTGKVLDADTGTPIRRAGLTFLHAEGAQEYMGTTLRWPTLDFDVLVPSTKPFRMKVWAPGYQTWYYGKDGTQAGAEPLRLSPGETKELVIRLHPAKSK
jgi:hypothetical protein